jgi:hypothetical protein
METKAQKNHNEGKKERRKEGKRKVKWGRNKEPTTPTPAIYIY